MEQAAYMTFGRALFEWSYLENLEEFSTNRQSFTYIQHLEE